MSRMVLGSIDDLTDDELDMLAEAGVSGLEPYVVGARGRGGRGGRAGGVNRGGPIVLRRERGGDGGGQRTRDRSFAGPAEGGRTRGQFLQPSDQRRRMMGLGNLSLAFGTTGQLQAKCEKPLQPEKLVIASSAIADLRVLDLKVGVQSQMSSTEEMPASAFSADQTGYIECDPVRVGQDVTLILSNVAASGTAAVSAVLFGPAAE